MPATILILYDYHAINSEDMPNSVIPKYAIDNFYD